MPLRTLTDPAHLPALDLRYVRERPAIGLGPDDPAPRILLLYGSLRERSFSRLCVEEAGWEDGIRADVVALWADVRTATAPAQRNAVGQPELAHMADPSGSQASRVATAGRVT